MDNYEQIVQKKLVGWNTWNVRSMLSYVLMPYGFAINIGIKEYQEGDFLAETLLGRLEDGKHAQRVLSGIEKVYPQAHALNGEYTRVKVEWRNVVFEIETCSIEQDIFIKVTPYKNQRKPAVVVASAGIMWNKEGSVTKTQQGVFIHNKDASCEIKIIGQSVSDCTIPVSNPYIAGSMECEVYFYTGKIQSENQIQALLNSSRKRYEDKQKTHGKCSQYHQVIEETLAWNVIYDPIYNTLKTIVGRTWSSEWGGYVQHCWDMYFNALMHSLHDKEFAYNSIIEITREITETGFIPNCAAATGFVTFDRSQPPVGSMIVLAVYEKYKEKWLIEEVFDRLFQWNSWYFDFRQVESGILGWGSTPFEPKLDNHWESAGVGKFYGAAMESGLDNSPMYDNVEMDPNTSTMKLGDVGLVSLFITDTQALIDMAELLGKEKDVKALIQRLDVCKKGLERLWCEEKGIYLNLHTDSGEFDKQLSPTNFYPLLTGLVQEERANKMIDKHLLNLNEFWGEWVIPSISRDNPAFIEQDYWRGRIWPPMNILVYLGLKKAGKNKVAKEFAEKSGALIMKEWRINRHVHENYCALTGKGCNKENSEKFYTWGGLLAYIYIDAFED